MACDIQQNNNSNIFGTFYGNELDILDYKNNILDIALVQFGNNEYINFKNVDGGIEIILDEKIFNEKALGNKEYTIGNKSVLFNVKEFVEKSINLGTQYYNFESKEQMQDVITEMLNRSALNELLKEDVGLKENEKYDKLEVFNKLKDFTTSLGINVVDMNTYIDSYKTRTGVELDEIALADMLNNVIALSKDSKLDDFVEEVGHFVINTSNDKRIDKLLNKVHETPEWALYYNQYYAKYSQNKNRAEPEIDKLVRMEILGKIFKDILLKDNQKQEQKDNFFSNVILKVWNDFKKLFNINSNDIPSVLNDIKISVLANEIEKFTNKRVNDIFYSLSIKEQEAIKNAKESLNKSKNEIINLKGNLGNKELISDKNILANIVQKLNKLSDNFTVEDFTTTLLEYMLYREQHIKEISNKIELINKSNLNLSDFSYLVLNMYNYVSNYSSELDSYNNSLSELGVSNTIITNSIKRQKESIQNLSNISNELTNKFSKDIVVKAMKESNASKEMIDEAVSKMYSSQSDLGLIMNFLSSIKNSSNPIVQAIYNKIYATNVKIEELFYNKVLPLLDNINGNVWDLAVQRINDKVTGHYFHMYNPNKIKEYKEKKVNEFLKNINREFNVNIKPSFKVSDIYELEIDKKAIENIIERYNKLKDDIKDIIEIKPMNKSFYEKRKDLSKDTKNKIGAINQESYSILQKYIDKDGYINRNNISNFDKQRLRELEINKKQASSNFNIAGVLKVGDELRIAKELQSYNSSMADEFSNPSEDDIIRSSEAFDKFNAEYKKIQSSTTLTEEEKLEWLKQNGYIRFDNDFYLEYGDLKLKERDDVSVANIRNNIAKEIGIEDSEHSNLSNDEFIKLIQTYKVNLVKPYRYSNFISEYNIKDMPVEVLYKLRTIQSWMNNNTKTTSDFDVEIDINNAVNLINNGSVVYGYNDIIKTWETVKSNNMTIYSKFKAPKTIRVESSQFKIDLLEAKNKGVELEFLNTHTITDSYGNRRPNFYYARSVPNFKYNTPVTEIANNRQVQTKMKLTVNLMGVDTDIIVSPNNFWFDRTNLIDLTNPEFNKEMSGKTVQYKSSITDTINGVTETFDFLDNNYLDYFGISKNNIFGSAQKNIEEFNQLKQILDAKYSEDKAIGSNYKYFKLPQVRKSTSNSVSKSILENRNKIPESFKQMFSLVENDDAQGELVEEEKILTYSDALSLFRNGKKLEYKNSENKWVAIKSITKAIIDDKQVDIINKNDKLEAQGINIREAKTTFGVSKKTFNIKKSVPLYYQNELDNELISTDLKSSMAKYILMSTNYQEKSKLMHEVVQLNDVLKKQTYDKIKSGEKSNEYKAVDSYINREMFGAVSSSDTIITIWKANLSRVKTTQTIGRYIQKLNLAYKTIVPVVGAASAFVQSIVEGFGGKYYDMRNYRYAHSTVMKDVTSIISDVGDINYNSQVNKLTRILGFESPFDITETIGQSKIRRSLSSPGFLLYRVSDYLPKVISSVAVADNYRLVEVLNDNNETEYKFINKNTYFNVYKLQERNNSPYFIEKSELEKSWNELPSFAKTYYVNDKNEISFKNQGKIINIEETIVKISQDTRQVYTNFTGNLEKSDKPYMYDYPELQFLGLHKGWLFNAMGVWFKKDRINITSGQYERGLAFELFSNKSKFFVGLITGATSLANDDTLNDNQRYALRKSIMLTYMTLGSIALSILMNKNSDDDDNDYTKAYLAFLTTKLLQETISTSALGTPVELYTSMKDPMGATQSLTSLLGSVSDLASDEEISRGKYKGKTKRLRYLLKVIPMIKNIYEHKDMKSSNDYFRNKISYVDFLISEKSINELEDNFEN